MIHFVGAGPGAADLITMRGAYLLQETDVIIYAGSLVNPALLEYAKPGCQIYNSAEMTLEEVIEVMKDAEAKGLDTVRLHTGDASLYGAIREQMDVLDELGIEYEDIPGVTRMAGRTPVPEKESIREFAKHDCTMVIFLSTGLLDDVSKELMEGGYDADAPAALVYKATWPEEKVVHCTVSTLAKAAKENNITKTALILVGGFLGDKYERSKLYDPGFTTEFRKATE